MLLMGRSTISMALFNSYVSLPEGTLMFHRLLLQSPYVTVTVVSALGHALGRFWLGQVVGVQLGHRDPSTLYHGF